MATSDSNAEQSFSSSANALQAEDGDRCDLVGASPYATIESDPGVFTSIMQKLGVVGLAAQEILGLDFLESTSRQVPSWRIPYGFILCFKWREDSYTRDDYHNDEVDTQLPWFANQLSNDSCATLALLNIVLNHDDVDLGPFLTPFKEYTLEMDPAMRGLCVASSTELRQVHNNFARPADIRASLSKIADTTMNPPKEPKKPKGRGKAASKSKKATKSETLQDQYHFLSYVPYQGRVWEMDGLKSAPLECAELDAGEAWLEAVRPALRGRIEALSNSGDIRFNLLAIVPCAYQEKMTAFELGKREITYIERRLPGVYGEGWKDKVPESLYKLRSDAFSRPGLPSSRLGIGFGARSNNMAMEILRMSPELLLSKWEASVQRLIELQLSADDELTSAKDTTIEHIKRTHDYEPFIREYVTRLYNAGFLQELLDIDAAGRFRQTNQKAKR
ncbi:hypothetical protein M408DRAFT_323399 [Serendipita vermifera MAFF 305830]|uniref:ubiquitinyl hydrolase 1 n=1 Tax=Serendipita vermifera MAFF 305830 TaxID=933852 RepID=A0A0C2XNS7_SERVB|nr:hypothetical protein M408DRAFT_323399 [Serendipita vermifera MAFF 305830]